MLSFEQIVAVCWLMMTTLRPICCDWDARVNEALQVAQWPTACCKHHFSDTLPTPEIFSSFPLLILTSCDPWLPWRPSTIWEVCRKQTKFEMCGESTWYISDKFQICLENWVICRKLSIARKVTFWKCVTKKKIKRKRRICVWCMEKIWNKFEESMRRDKGKFVKVSWR